MAEGQHIPVMRRRFGAIKPLAAPGPRLSPIAPPGTISCKSCDRRFAMSRFEEQLRVCPSCGYHSVVPAKTRAVQLGDAGSVEILPLSLENRDPLQFDDGVPYSQRVEEARSKTGLEEAFVIARASIGGRAVVLACMDFAFMGGSLGSAAGEIFARACDAAVGEKRALIAVCSSGGARMQEGIASLAQMARCSEGVRRVGAAKLPYISILCDPCFGGVTASFAVQADVILAEPGARVGFAGGRVIEQAAHQKLPEGFQTSEFLLAHGMLDAVVERSALPETIATLLRAFQGSPS